MTQITTGVLIDPMDINIPLTVVLEKETTLMNRLRQMSYVDEKKEVIYVTSLAWILESGYVPRFQEFTLKNGMYVLENWKQGHLYMGSRHWEKEGLLGFPKELDYCSMTGEDLEYDSLSWQAAKDIIQLAPTSHNNKTGVPQAEFVSRRYPEIRAAP